MIKRIVCFLLLITMSICLWGCKATSNTSSTDAASTASNTSSPSVILQDNPNIGITSGFKGVQFAPNIPHSTFDGYGFPYFQEYYGEYREAIKGSLKDLADNGFNFITVWLCNLHVMQNPRGVGNKADQPLEEWADLSVLNNFAAFLDDCYVAGINVEIDLVDNRWMPYSLDTAEHIGGPSSWWPTPSEEPWKEAATFYTQVIEYVESKAQRPEVIAMWTMMGNYHWGAAEPAIWDGNPTHVKAHEDFIKYCWPKFVEAGERPKGSPFMMPILSATVYWVSQPPEARISGYRNLKKWLVDDLKLSPDYWVMSTLSYCDPAEDGFYYLKAIREILGDNAKIISTDFGMYAEFDQQINYFSDKPYDVPSLIKWNMEKCKEYNFAGWWIWDYQDKPNSSTGLKTIDGKWKDGVLEAIHGEE